MPKWLVTGGYGFIGSNIVKELVSRNEEVCVIDDLSTGRKQNLKEEEGKFKYFNADILDKDALDQAVHGVDYILHQAAIPSVQRSVDDPEGSNNVNVNGTIAVLEAARRAKVKRVIYAASSSAYGDQPQTVKTEELCPMPLSPYAVGKLAAEYYLGAFYTCYGLETVSLRYFNVFGPNQDPNSEYSAVIPLFITKCLNNESPTIYGDGTQSRDFTYVLNNVIANITAATTTSPVAGNVFNIACGKSFTLLDLLNEINRILGKNIKPIFAEPRRGDVKHSLASIEKAHKSFGYSVQVDFHDGLRKTIEWYMRNN